MKTRLLNWMVGGGSVVLAESLLAADGDMSASGLTKIGAALAIGVGAAGVATGQGKAASSALEGIGRNPTSRGEVFVPLLLSLVFMEFQALLCFVVSYLILNG